MGQIEMPPVADALARILYANRLPNCWPNHTAIGQGDRCRPARNPSQIGDRRITYTPYMAQLNVLADPTASTNCTALTKVDSALIWAVTQKPADHDLTKALAGTELFVG